MRQRFILFIVTMLGVLPASFSQISFTADVASGCGPLDVNFTNTSSVGDYYHWFYGDGYSDYYTTQNNHVFQYGGTYTVTMDAYDNTLGYLGSSSMTIEVSGAPNGLWTSQSIICPYDVLNVGTWVDAPYYNYDFGDGSPILSTEYTNVEHVYSSPGFYTITMQYYDQSCGQYYTVYEDIEVNATMPYFGGMPQIYASESTICPGTTVNFSTNAQSNSGYNWDFGNGNFDNAQQTSTVYNTVGSYTASLLLTNGCGVDTTLYHVITVGNSVVPTAVPINAPSEICLGEEFYASGYGPTSYTYTFDFGDGSPLQTGANQYAYHTYSTAGSYTVTLTVENLCGNTAVSSFNTVVSTNAPIADPYFDVNPNTVCPGDEVNFYIPWQYDYYFDFGDGTGTTDGHSHSYDSPGIYPVYAIIQNTCGSTEILYDTVYVQLELPFTGSPYMGANPDPACPGTDIEFYAEYGYASYHWDFGDGYTSDYPDVSHPYNFPGTYTYTLTVTNGCGAHMDLTDQIQISNTIPVASMNWEVWGNEACPGAEIFMTADQDGDLTYAWDFGDGNTSTDTYTSHAYDTPGVYTVALTATNSCGSSLTETYNINVSNSAGIDMSIFEFGVQTPACIGDNLYFAVVPYGMADYSWDFGDGNSGVSDELLFVEGQPYAVGFHAYDAPGTYTATITATNSCGFTMDSTVTVEIGNVGSTVPIDVFFWHQETEITCEGQPVTFFAVGASTYVWDFGDGSGQLITYNSLDPVQHTYSEYGSYQVSVTGLNACGGSDVSDEMIFIPDSDIDVVTNTVVDSDCGENNGVAIVTASGGTQPYTYSWTNGDSGVIADSLGSGIYVVTVTDNNGCATEAIASVSDDQGPVILLENIVDNECYGDNDGVITVSVLGGAPPYDILWSNGENSEDIFNLEAGPYEIFVTDANGCFSAKSFEVGQPAQSIVSVYSTPATCNGFDGAASASVSNGVAPYNFIWPNGAGTSSTATNLAPGVYELMVIDGNTCLLTANFVVNEADGPVIVTDSITDATCSGDLSAVFISTIGGTGPFDYTWSNSTTNEDLTGVLPGEYSVEVEGSNGCSSFMIVNLEMSAPDQTDICMVTVDTLTNSNLIVWNPVASADVVSYNIYKESSQNGLYFLVANQSADSLSQYFDYPSNPAIRSWRYKVAAVDDCGNEAELSEPHKTMHLTSNLGVGGVVNLIWDHYNGFSYDTYYIWRYHPTTGWMKIDSLGSNNISYTDMTPPDDSNLVYMVEVLPPSTCTAAKAQDYNSSRSNKSSVNMPDFGENTGLAEETARLSIYPNPTSGQVNLLYSTVISEVRIYDLSGQLVYRMQNTSNSMVIDCADFARGVYSIELVTENGLLHSKLIKQ